MNDTPNFGAVSAMRKSFEHDPVVAQASGMVAVQSNRLPREALDLMARYAASNQRGIKAVARDVVAGRVRFDAAGEGYANAGIDPA